MLQRTNLLPNWQAPVQAVEAHFGHSLFDSPRATLFKLQQVDSVQGYYHEFASLANRVEGLTDAALLDCFISGPKSDVKREVKNVTDDSVPVIEESVAEFHHLSHNAFNGASGPGTLRFKVSGAEIILVASWLATLGPHVADYCQLIINFFDGSVFVTLQGDSNLSPSATQAQYHLLRRLHQTDVISTVFTLHSQMSSDAEDPFVDLVPTPPSDVVDILRQYVSVFHKPRGLPLPQSHDHAISLLPDVPPVKVRPYRYPFSYKAEIEKIVGELLQEGLIQHNTSPFSSLVILVKMKMGLRRFCTDYRALNAITIKDCFLIPTVDE
ncbi:uncharacterized protein LOC113855835 [Abrus precatorius]|uniref:Uncharacterized protein LOC113855835 n=1 Tax=Abrus precatorius TaxID=3816 RepID=A0A8B8KHH1_ABRPR|nr:uncharacterized protein LOC113855835 [Abrus precatorius]